MSKIVSDILFSLNIVSLFSSKPLSALSGNSFVLPTKSSILISIFLGIIKSPNEAINISWNTIRSTVFPFAAYAKITFPSVNPAITPSLPSLFKSPAINPDIAYAAIIIGSVPVIIPSTTPIVIPPVAPTSMPFFQPSTKTINILKIFFNEKPKMFKLPNAVIVIASKRLVPVTSSIVNALLFPKSIIIVIEFVKIL